MSGRTCLRARTRSRPVLAATTQASRCLSGWRLSTTCRSRAPSLRCATRRSLTAAGTCSPIRAHACRLGVASVGAMPDLTREELEELGRLEPDSPLFGCFQPRTVMTDEGGHAASAAGTCGSRPPGRRNWPGASFAGWSSARSARQAGCSLLAGASWLVSSLRLHWYPRRWKPPRERRTYATYAGPMGDE